ncbi:globin domain-containing protein [Pleurocapsa sp. PCC 7319]|uniref:globin domain-containing protein n=1 Tax=Pleurocapsa sp. PCC 7319 TaxID=118161 RepID=UPI00034D7B38|nr:globin domain-containing protein [Pleurocapsa sp. PCC 7319]
MSLKIELIEQSLELIKPKSRDFVHSFYQNLFIAYPETKRLFAKTDMKNQEKKLLNSLVLLVESLRQPIILKQILADLGARHKQYGTLPQYYPLVGEILLKTFADYLQQDWTDEVKQAWIETYNTVTNMMLEGAGVDTSLQPQTPQTATTVIQQERESAPQFPKPIQLNKKTTSTSPENIQIELVEQSFAKIEPQGSAFAASFYQNLFAAYPETQQLFAKTDIGKQEKKFINSLVLLVESLRQPEILKQILADLGSRHKQYGTLPQYYPLVGDILLQTFAEYLQQDWTDEVKQAWVTTYNTVTNMMLEGASGHTVNKIPLETEVSPKKPFVSFDRLNAKFKSNQEKQTVKITSLASLLRSILDKLLEEFWALPTWAVAVGSAFFLSFLYLVADDETFLAELLEGADAISLLVALVLYIKETPDRKKEFHYQAWSTIDNANGVKVSYARILALQDLNEDRVPLKGLIAPNANLAKINLPKADLSDVNLTKANLSNANLSHANLGNALLARVNFTDANLSYANLGFAKLSYVNLSSANLSHANLVCTDLRDANLSGTNLSRANLSGADLHNAYFTGANLKDAKVNESDLRQAYLKGATMPDGSTHP